MAEEYQDISAERVREYMARHEENEYLLVDVRQPDEYAKGHIAGSILVPLGEIPQRMQELPVDKDLILYCRSGKRSKGAAIFIGSRPYVAGTVFNMTGGILAWDGHLLPSTPNLKIFDLSGSEQELLLQAMDLERGAEQFYAALSRRYGAVPWTESLAVLAGAEEAHARMIYRFWAEGQGDPPSFETVFSGLAGDIVEGGFSSPALVATLEEQPMEPCRATLEMALTIEYSAYDLSRNMAHRYQDQPMEAVFTTIAEAEKEHVRLVAQALAFCQGG
ncbi:rhodanese-like domain-containing protein [uncultured Desulfobulbus sp.]|uniref:rhodanese-like domain-containing protein n=1 Tax=uncultured Desulfobulbus sp. TaxID=239745 RepID=UPI0029C6FBC5|nr:rhodanese-like domain-containing protein [uncultured Desulfobulbus sp.]